MAKKQEPRRIVNIPPYPSSSIGGSYQTEGGRWVKNIEEEPYINYSGIDEVIATLTRVKDKFREGGAASVELEEKYDYGSSVLAVFVRGTRWATDEEAAACEEAWERAAADHESRREAEKERIRREYPEMFK